jgi:DUF1365 family protein
MARPSVGRSARFEGDDADAGAGSQRQIKKFSLAVGINKKGGRTAALLQQR